MLMSDYIWFDVRLEFYDDPDRRQGYHGSATRPGFRSVCLPRVGELLANPTIIVGALPGPPSEQRRAPDRHRPRPRRREAVGDPSSPGPAARTTEIEQLRSAGWRLDINQTP